MAGAVTLWEVTGMPVPARIRTAGSARMPGVP
jgi:hypothetical protein